MVGYSAIILYLLSNKIVINKLSAPGGILVIGAHPDDIEIAARGQHRQAARRRL